MSNFQTKTFIKHDDYMTPKSAWKNIIHLLDKTKTYWEGFYGDGKSGNFLTELGLTTIHEEIDFFNDETLPIYDILISNPPFSQCKTILNRLYELDKPFILILPSSKINTGYFRQWKDRNIQIIIPPKRIHFTKLIEGEKPNNYKSSCNFDCFYYCYKIGLDKDITWLDNF